MNTADSCAEYTSGSTQYLVPDGPYTRVGQYEFGILESGIIFIFKSPCSTDTTLVFTYTDRQTDRQTH